MFDVIDLQRFIPANVKFALKPYYRRIFPNRLHIVLNPTWRCNYQCSYCPVVTTFTYTNVVGRSGERPGADWLEALAKLPPAVIYIAGGEPFVYADLPVIINEIPDKHRLLGIVTNLSLPASAYRRISRKMHLNASFHREHVDIPTFVAKIKELKGQFHIHAYIVATPENLRVLDQISHQLGALGVSLHVDPYVDRAFRYSPDQMRQLRRHIKSDRQPESQLDFEDFSPKRCSAGRNYVIFSPDGSAYTCYGGMNFIHSGLYRDIVMGHDVSGFRVGNIFDPRFHLNAKDQICSMPCNAACDRDTVIIRPCR
jgi:MoaA/NifB/PqqE/SkfB family radical SAM enzyme